MENDYFNDIFKENLFALKKDDVILMKMFTEIDNSNYSNNRN